MAAREFSKKLKCISEGRFGKVWIVKSKVNQRIYVLKEIKVEGLSNKEIDETVSEVAVLSRFRHLNILRYKQAFVEKESLDILIEYADGGDLYQRVEEQAVKGEYFEESLVLNWTVQICFALKHMHKENTLHKDLKLQSIFLTKDNVIKVGDLGIPKVLKSDSGKMETTTGTVHYTAPEIYQSQPYTNKSDIWSLGCLLYELSTLKHAFDSTSANNIIVKIIHGDYGKLPSHYPYCPVSSLIEMMLQHKPEDRPAADQILRVPFLKPHVSHYGSLATKLLKTQREKKLSMSNTPLPQSYGKHSLSETESKTPETPMTTKQLSKSFDLEGRGKGDLRKTVMIRQALTRRSSCANNSSYPLPPFLSPIYPSSSPARGDNVQFSFDRSTTDCTIDELDDDVFKDEEDSRTNSLTASSRDGDK